MSRAYLLFLVIATSTVRAAVCSVSDSPDTCKAILLERAEAQVSAQSDTADSIATATLGKINTGPSAATTAAATSAFTDFFSLLNVAAQSDQTGTDDDEALGFEWNRCTPGLGSTSPLQCQVRARLGESTLYAPLKDALPEATRANRSAELEEGLDRTDNVSVGVFLNLASEKYGRVPRFGKGSIYADIREQIRDETRAKTQSAAQAGFQWLAFLETLPATFDAENTRTPFSAYPDGADGRKALELYEQTLAPRIAAAVETQALLQSYGYFDLIDLVNNQPQINGGIEFNQRDELVGPDELRAKISYELGPANMNDLQSYMRAHADVCARERPRGAAAAAWRGVAGCTADFLRRPDVARSLNSSSRLSFTAEYVRRKHYTVNLPDDALALDLPAQHSLIASVVWGGYVRLVAADKRATRFDLAASYEDASSGPLRQDRGIANLTFSHSLVNGLIASASLVYATKPEFHGDVRKEWSSRLGINYKFGLPGEAGTN